MCPFLSISVVASRRFLASSGTSARRRPGITFPPRKRNPGSPRAMGATRDYSPGKTPVLPSETPVAEVDRFRLTEFSNKYLGGRPVAFTSCLEFLNNGSGMDGSPPSPAIPIFRLSDSEGQETLEILGEREQKSEEMITVDSMDKATGERMWKTMARLEVLDRVLYEAQRQGRLSFYMTNTGEEAAQVGSAAALHAQDLVYGQYRETGVLLWRGFSFEECINQCIGNKLEPAKGRQMPIHYGSQELNFVTISPTLGTKIPQAVGSAYSFKLANASARSDDEKRVVCVYFGDGAFSEGDAHGGLQLAATLKCPVVFICRNNGWAISTPVSEQYASDGIAGRALCYGIDTIRVDGNDAMAMWTATQAARGLAMRNRPVLVEAMTYRRSHHSTSDDASAYRPAGELRDWEARDQPVDRFRRFCEHRGWLQANDGSEKHFRDECLAAMLEALSRLERVPRGAPEEVLGDVYAEPQPPHIRRQQRQLIAHLQTNAEHYAAELARHEKIGTGVARSPQ